MAAQLSRCKSCGAPIYWVKTEAGKNMPVDAKPVADGNIIFVGQVAFVIKQGHGPVVDQPRYVSHFVTCKNAATHRRKKKAVSS